MIHTHAAENRDETEPVRQLTGQGNGSFHQMGCVDPGRYCPLSGSEREEELQSQGQRCSLPFG